MMTSDDLSCQQVVALVTEYLEAALLPAIQAKMEEHLADCSDCQTFLHEIQQTIAMLHKLAEEPMFPETKQQLLQLFQTWKQTSHAGE